MLAGAVDVLSPALLLLPLLLQGIVGMLVLAVAGVEVGGEALAPRKRQVLWPGKAGWVQGSSK